MNNNKKYYIGIDVGGTNMKAGLFDGKKIIMESIGPNKNNVELEGLLIIERYRHKEAEDLISVPITKIDKKYITATFDNKSFYAYLYKEALILKKDKSFLIGKEVPDYFLKSYLKQNNNFN